MYNQFMNLLTIKIKFLLFEKRTFFEYRIDFDLGNYLYIMENKDKKLY